MYHGLIIAGHPGTDPELRFTLEGTPVASFLPGAAEGKGWMLQEADP